jgi:hypothetical protein
MYNLIWLAPEIMREPIRIKDTKLPSNWISNVYHAAHTVLYVRHYIWHTVCIYKFTGFQHKNVWFLQFHPPACLETASALGRNLSHTHKKLILLFIILADMKNHVTKYMYVWDYNFLKSVLGKYFSDVVVNSRIKVNAVHSTANSKQIFPEKKLRSLVLIFHIHVSVSDCYIPTIGLPILLLILQQETHVAVLGGLR